MSNKAALFSAGCAAALISVQATGQTLPPPQTPLELLQASSQASVQTWKEKARGLRAVEAILKENEHLKNGPEPDATLFKELAAMRDWAKEEVKKAEAQMLAFQKTYRVASAVEERGKARTNLVRSGAADPPTPGDRCLLDTDQQIREFHAACLKASEGISQGDVTLFGRVVEKEGATAQVQVGKEGQKFGLRFADSYVVRSRGGAALHEEVEYQRKWTLGYNFGVQTTNLTDEGGRLAGLSERSRVRSLTDLDRLDEKISFTAGISFNKYPRVYHPILVSSAKPIVEAARDACKAQLETAPGSGCEGEALVKWINSNPVHLAALRTLYLGGEQKVAEWGVGLQGEVARPVFTYFPFATVEVPDPLSPGSTKKVIDLAQLPAGFPNSPSREAKVPFAVTPYVFRHFPSSLGWFNGLTLIGSGTWKRTYEIEESRRDIVICPVSDGVPLETNELCRKVNAAAPASLSEYLLAGELRAKFGKFWMFSGGVGIAPKLTQELRRGRRSLDVPVYLSADKEGNLTGGLRFKWDTDGKDLFGVDRKDELFLSIFVGTTFDLDMEP